MLQNFISSNYMTYYELVREKESVREKKGNKKEIQALRARERAREKA
jgi:hypothetical protein